MRLERRTFICQSSLSLFGLSGYKYLHLKFENTSKEIHDSYPTTDPAQVRAVVGAAHTKLDVVKELVSARPELAKATYDWGFGDVESALGAASHMGRKDIADFLMDYGARPNIFTFAMLGKLDSVKQMINDLSGIERIRGPHGFTLLWHAQVRLNRNNVEGREKLEQEALVEYLQLLDGANIPEPSNTLSEAEQEQYLGKYIFGEGADEYFEIKKNSMGSLSMSRAEYTGRFLKYQGDQLFTPGGAPSVKIIFEESRGKINALTIHDPDPILSAHKV